MGRQIGTIEKMKEIAKERGGECLSKEYINSNTKLKWKCEKGHVWEAIPHSIKGSSKRAGTWCPVCAGSQPLSIEQFHKIAKERGGECLSKEYINSNTKLKWKCEKGHVWEATPMHIKHSKSWCLICSGKEKHTIEKMKEIANERGGECLSKEYINSNIKLKWKCEKGHVWEVSPINIVNNNAWCKKCAGKEILNIKEFHKIAKERGGECLSKEYKNNASKLKFVCNFGHIWETTGKSIKGRNSWCPECSAGLNERYTRILFESLFNTKFIKIKPIWLVNSRGNKMELDGYSKELSLAFEYQGVQHYKKNGFFHRDNDSLKQRINDDKLKKKVCKSKGIFLMGIPYYIQTEDLKQYIIENLPKTYSKKINTNFEIKQTYYVPDNQLIYLQNIALTNEGELLSKEYLGSNTKLKWKCKEGHVWEAKPGHIKNRGTWCPKCSYKDRNIGRILNIKQANALAEKMRGICLSKKYINSSVKMKWQCKNGHSWMAKISDIKNGLWCSKCESSTDRIN